MPVTACGALAKQECKAPDSDQREGQIGSYISKIGDAEETTVICELMVRKRLWNARDQTTGNRDHCRKCD